ncbi:MFS transporter [Nocardioides yefusunii]|uniref:MFS transporter n=1 Tax=Nocardioides yefusunii TaxID=2500546 RepID=A0ABW1QVR0_9ACTN|nr:MFS transporter [Nocardioides yefusunii]
MAVAPTSAGRVVPTFAAVVALLAGVEVASGVLQGFYTPIFPALAEHLRISEGDLNWFEAAQLTVSALCIPLLSRLADLWGHKRVMVLATAITALASWATAVAPGFWTFLGAWALQGAYIVWLPIEVAIVYRITADTGEQGRLTRKAAAILVGVLETSVIVAALSSGALVDRLDMNVMLAIPAAVTTLCLVLMLRLLPDLPPTTTGRRLDAPGLALVTTGLVLLLAGLMLVRLDGPGAVRPWLLVVLGLVVMVGLVRHSARTADPLVDVRLLATSAQWPIQITAFLFGFSVLGAQIPLSTFAQADPDVTGYGLGAGASFVSILVGVYVLTMAVGAFTLPLWSRLLGARNALVLAAALVALGYALWIPLHDSTVQGLVNMGVAGVGSGMLIAALPAAAAAAAPADRTGFATGMTNATKAVGGAIASSIFAIALASTGSLGDPEAGHAPLSGYLTVWSVCAVAALAAACLLLLAPKDVFEGVDETGPVGAVPVP